MNHFYGYGIDQSGSTSNTSSGGGTGWLGALGGWMDDNSSWLSGLGNTAGQVYSIDRALSEANRVSDLGNYLNDWANQQGALLNEGSAFKGYGITGTGLSKVWNPETQSFVAGPTTGTVGDDGAFNLAFNVRPDATLATQGQTQRTSGGTSMNLAGDRLRDAYQMVDGVNYMDAATDAIDSSLQSPAQRQNEIYNQLMAMQEPTLNRQQMAQQAQEYAMGRGGVRGTQYGGTAEDAAMARARADASRQSAMDAMTQAQNERGMFAQMGAQYGTLYNQQNQQMANIAQQYQDRGMNRYELGLKMEEMKYLPQDMQLKIMNQMMAGSDAAQTGQLTGLGYLNDMLLGGMSNNVNAQKVSSELRGNLYNALLSNLGGTTGNDGSSATGLGGLLGGLSGGLKWLDEFF
jgi:hypothetical protein